MRKIRNICCVIILLTITSCGFVNNMYLIGYNLTDIMPNRHRVTKSIEKNFPKNGLAIVDINFRVKSQGEGVNTVWRRINEDGTYSRRMALTNMDYFKIGRARVALKPGVYFLDGVRYMNEGRYISIGAFNEMYLNKQKGWNESKNEPIYFSFIAEAGKELKIPDVFIFANCKYGGSSCSAGLRLNMFISENPKDKNNNYKTGLKVKRLDVGGKFFS